MERRIAVREVDLAKLKCEQKPKQGKREPLSELSQTNSHEQSGESWRLAELIVRPVVSRVDFSLLMGHES